ncbi:MAG: hypothetical protein AB7O72_15510, partial [Ramlibacter sp.]
MTPQGFRGYTRRLIQQGSAGGFGAVADTVFATLPLEIPMSKKPVRVAVTGAAGQIGYALLFRIASG